MQSELIIQFRQKVLDFYTNNRRDFAWRRDITPYAIVVSEIMLQQTQTSRVVLKFEQWMQQFPTLEKLAQASVHDVLFCWQGLGYNRRALALYDFAKKIVADYAGIIPADSCVLQTFKGIGLNTAGSICAFAFNKPVVFIETNIRTVFLHTFFQGKSAVDDKEILPFVAAAVDQQNPRDWYYALMDYGVYLKKELKLSNRQSKQYAKQSKFIGSRRQVRGMVLSLVIKHGAMSYEQLQELVWAKLPGSPWCVYAVVKELCDDGLLPGQLVYEKEKSLYE